MGEGLESVGCVLCGGDDSRAVIRGPGALRVVQCRRDGLMYLNPRPSTAELRDFHRHFVRPGNLPVFDAFRRSTLRREAMAIERRKAGGRLLDIGCATGTLLESFDRRRWQLYGVDTSPLAVQATHARCEADTFCGTLDEAGYPTAFFDVVTVLDTLYYCPDPQALLREAHRVLRPDGLLAVEVPGFRYTLLREKGLLCWLADGKWMRGFASSRRLYLFSPHTLGLLLSSVGFRAVEMIPEQASQARRGLGRLLNESHFLLSKALFKASGGRLSIAGKEFYLAVKAAEPSRD